MSDQLIRFGEFALALAGFAEIAPVLVRREGATALGAAQVSTAADFSNPSRVSCIPSSGYVTTSSPMLWPPIR